MKYAFLIPIYNTISGRLLPQFLHLQDWCRNLDGEIFTVVGRTHVDARYGLMQTNNLTINSYVRC